ncbi:MAG: phage baseplate upper protein, partial [Acetobacter sp.]|nr:phage baseplate upper protein [Bacteroides sp.]MCM1342045.1 phage baseplate upper protein [Acetobacter sp.]MCM1434269.1 phage baseplate upper protein [Clostridiales bacterium]
MNKSIYRKTLDVQKNGIQFSINAVKNEALSRQLIISIVDGGKPLDLSGKDVQAILYAVKPDGQVLYNACEINGNTIKYDFTQQTVSVSGEVTARIKFIAENAVLYAPQFSIMVDDVEEFDDAVLSTNEYSALVSMSNDTKKLCNEIERKLENGDFVGQQGEKGDKGDSAGIIDNCITTPKLADGAVTSDKLAEDVKTEFEQQDNKTDDTSSYNMIACNNKSVNEDKYYPTRNSVIDYSSVTIKADVSFKNGVYLSDGTVDTSGEFANYCHAFIPVELNQVYHIRSWGALSIANERMLCFIKDGKVLDNYGKSSKDRYIFITILNSSYIVYIYKKNDNPNQPWGYVYDESKMLSDMPDYVVVNNYNETLNPDCNLPVIEKMWIPIKDIVKVNGDGTKFLSDNGKYEELSADGLDVTNSILTVESDSEQQEITL